MSTWVLVFVLSVTSGYPSPRGAVAINRIEGFTSEAACHTALHELLKLKNVEGFTRDDKVYLAIACVAKK